MTERITKYHFLDEARDELTIEPLDDPGGGIAVTVADVGVFVRPDRAEELIAAIRRGCGLDTAPDLDQVRADLAAIARIEDDAATTEELGNVDPALRRLLAEHAPRLVVEVERTRAADAIRRAAGLADEPETSTPLDLDAIRADQVTATTSPVRPSITRVEVDAWNRAVERCSEVHVPTLLAEVERQDRRIADLETDAERDRLAAELHDERTAVNAWITNANNGHGSDVGDLMHALEKARASKALDAST
ncbi:hypothetical protein OG948_21345 [Embleya sp. NBC_00888]|uniref:hypothetical protein n=1 Tax=Embleya sp. NBC_00888 TaxID=2975960 RepID=UPI00386D49F2|nr:hypothetical protein OG948_21345 [Embleya sp. NBC_00888]